MSRQKSLLIVLIVALIVVLAVLWDDAQAQAELPVMRYLQFQTYDPVYVAIENGYFEDHGLMVELAGDTLAGPTAIQAVSAGKADAALSSLPAIINANAAGLPIYAISDVQSAFEDQPLEIYYVQADSDIQSVADLAGKTFAVNLWFSSFHYTALLALEQAGVDPADVNFVLLPFANQAEALAQGDVDVIGVLAPYDLAAELLYPDQFRVLFTALDVFGARQVSTHFVNRIWAEYNPERVTAFVSGVRDAAAFIHASPDEARQIISQYTGIQPEHIPDYRLQPDARVVVDDFQFWLDVMLERGDITADWLVVHELAGNRYNTAVED